jgi:hypothetical protein
MVNDRINIVPPKEVKPKDVKHDIIDGIKYWRVPAMGSFEVSKNAKAGDRVEMGSKLYEIQKDRSLKRLDKVKGKKKNKKKRHGN